MINKETAERLKSVILSHFDEFKTHIVRNNNSKIGAYGVNASMSKEDFVALDAQEWAQGLVDFQRQYNVELIESIDRKYKSGDYSYEEARNSVQVVQRQQSLPDDEFFVEIFENSIENSVYTASAIERYNSIMEVVDFSPSAFDSALIGLRGSLDLGKVVDDKWAEMISQIKSSESIQTMRNLYNEVLRTSNVASLNNVNEITHRNAIKDFHSFCDEFVSAVIQQAQNGNTMNSSTQEVEMGDE